MRNGNGEVVVGMEQGFDRSVVIETLGDMLENIFGFAMSRTRDRSRAEDISQAVCVEVLLSWESIRSSEALRGWIWSIARHTYSRWVRSESRDRTVFISNSLPASLLADGDDVTQNLLLAEDIKSLRREIALLSSSYREVIVAHYLRNLSYSDIAASLNLSLSTVKWRLHEARRMLSEGMSVMREFGQLSYSPKNLSFTCHGNWSITEYMKSLLRQNIFAAAYSKPVSISDLTVELGVASAYVEDEVASMVSREALEVTPGGRYRTRFILHTAEAHDRVLSILKQLWSDIETKMAMALYQAQKVIESGNPTYSNLSWSKLHRLIKPDIIYTVYDRLSQGLFTHSSMPKHSDGSLGWMIAWEPELNYENILSRSNMYLSDSCHGMVYQAVYWIDGRGWEKILKPEDLSLLCDIAFGHTTDSKSTGSLQLPTPGSDTQLEEALARLIATGHLRIESDMVTLGCIALTKADKEELNRLIEPIVTPIYELAKSACQAVTDTLLPITPAHLQDQVPVVALSLVTEIPADLSSDVILIVAEK